MSDRKGIQLAKKPAIVIPKSYGIDQQKIMN